MNMKSDLQNTTGFTRITLSFIELLHKNSYLLVSAVIIYVIITAITNSPPASPTQEYDCSLLSTEKQATLSSTVSSRLALIEKAMNTSLSASHSERGDMQDTIEMIMADTRKEFCTPIGIKSISNE